MGNEPSKSSNAIARRSSSSSLHSNYSHSDDYAVTVGNADARVINNGKVAVAMAKGKSGAAYAWTDGRHYDCQTDGKASRAGAGGGVAYAQVGKKNVAVAVSGQAVKESRRLAASGKQPKLLEMPPESKEYLNGKNKRR